ncbi:MULTISPECIES: PEPxxWA-CTERM sorting domain-containing protein [Sphingomonas]|nr:MULTISPECIES: PEPxxWA-CTERM sorting domain-containing protein [Sphingomonas]
MKLAALLVASALGITANQADAAVVTKHFVVSATGFEAGAPVPTASGVFSFTYDNAAFITPITSAGLAIRNFNLPYTGVAKFTFNKGNDFLMVSDNISGLVSFTISPVVPGFGFVLRNPGGTPFIQTFLYSGSGKIWHASRIGVRELAAVPEPASWLMLIAGFAATGAALRASRRRGKVAFA